MAIRTTATTAKSSSYSKPSTPKKPSTASRSNSVTKSSTAPSAKAVSSAIKRDTFTYSSPTAKQAAVKTPTTKTSTASKSTATKASTAKTNATSSQTTASKAVSTAKTAASAKSTQTNKSASAVKTTTTAKASNAKTSSAAKSTATVSNTKRDTFTYSSEAVKNVVKSATSSKSTANSKSTSQNNAKNSQTKTAVKIGFSGTVTKNKAKSALNEIPEGLKLHFKHTKDPEQRAKMSKTMKNISDGVLSEKAGKNNVKKTYISPKKTEVSSGMEYSIEDLLRLNGSTVFVVNDGKVSKGENVEVDIDKNRAEIIMTTSNKFDIDPTLIIAVMAHESRFQPDSSSEFASGLMQVNNQYFSTYASENKELIESLGGDYTDIYDEAANIVAWGASYSIWVDTYGDNKDSLKALRQGNIKPYTSSEYPYGWSLNATNNANEFMDIKNELDNMIK